MESAGIRSERSSSGPLPRNKRHWRGSGGGLRGREPLPALGTSRLLACVPNRPNSSASQGVSRGKRGHPKRKIGSGPPPRNKRHWRGSGGGLRGREPLPALGTSRPVAYAPNRPNSSASQGVSRGKRGHPKRKVRKASLRGAILSSAGAVPAATIAARDCPHPGASHFRRSAAPSSSRRFGRTPWPGRTAHRNDSAPA